MPKQHLKRLLRLPKLQDTRRQQAHLPWKLYDLHFYTTFRKQKEGENGALSLYKSKSRRLPPTQQGRRQCWPHGRMSVVNTRSISTFTPSWKNRDNDQALSSCLNPQPTLAHASRPVFTGYCHAGDNFGTEPKWAYQCTVLLAKPTNIVQCAVCVTMGRKRFAWLRSDSEANQDSLRKAFYVKESPSIGEKFGRHGW